ncbi:hypothetical protein A1O1_02210 [Capronia coronata CBS 617.96]|uniref:Ubiquitin-like domain-containing protein n=1 Tax=Capronia coronata CBS 617.96 TaxID=1182541 RepID=W9YLP6_9EURO|nr:uncharacterized protein A1O1_02210 [Capronia coronata CBS 617.96]EXJ93817.1 hypothetical protein A1O1_02210 [Capronia coronata CBS 617.96]
MGDLQFAKQFLTTLDNKANKYPADHVFDPKTFQMRIPYTLPKLSSPPHPLPPKTTASARAPGSESASSTIAVTLKSARNPNMTLMVPSVDPSTTTIHALKEQVQSYLGGPTVVHIDKIKVLLDKKPVPPSKRTVAEALQQRGQEGEVEFGVMVMGGAPDPPPQTQEAAPDAQTASAPSSEEAVVEVEQKKPEPTPMEDVEPASTSPAAPVQPGGVSGQDVLKSSEFWDDLQGFLEQRLRDQAEAVKLRELFERTWSGANSGL